MQEKILDFLKKKPEYLSGDSLSQRLGISRQALWKHIQELKELGYDIEAVPHLGYRLLSSPDKLLPAEVSDGLGTKFIGKKIYYFDAASSTMDISVELGLKQACEGSLVLAETQTKGKGRLGRSWQSPKYKGIYLSLILRPKIAPVQVSVLTLLAAVSICEAIKEACALEARIKWPNDILIHQKKTGGILTELNAEADQVRFLVIGIGLNVNNDKKTLPLAATSLKEQKKEAVSRIAILQEILRKIENNYLVFQKDGSAAAIDKWREYNITLDSRVKVNAGKAHFEGQAVDIDTDGALLLRNDHGLIQRVTAGDVVHCR